MGSTGKRQPSPEPALNLPEFGRAALEDFEIFSHTDIPENETVATGDSMQISLTDFWVASLSLFPSFFFVVVSAVIKGRAPAIMPCHNLDSYSSTTSGSPRSIMPGISTPAPLHVLMLVDGSSSVTECDFTAQVCFAPFLSHLRRQDETTTFHSDTDLVHSPVAVSIFPLPSVTSASS